VQNTFNLQNHRAFDKTLEAALNNISGKFVCPMLVACTVFWSLDILVDGVFTGYI